jgi:hypothetical protein
MVDPVRGGSPASDASPMDKLSEIRARWEKATPGPWSERRRAVEIEDDGRAVYKSDIVAGAHDIAYKISRPRSTRLPQDRYTPESSFDAAAIAAAPADVSWLCAEVDRLRALLAAGTPQPTATGVTTCDCGAIMTHCDDCAVGNYQAAHPECRTCCVAPDEINARLRAVVPPPPDTAPTGETTHGS